MRLPSPFPHATSSHGTRARNAHTLVPARKDAGSRRVRWPLPPSSCPGSPDKHEHPQHGGAEPCPTNPAAEMGGGQGGWAGRGGCCCGGRCGGDGGSGDHCRAGGEGLTQPSRGPGAEPESGAVRGGGAGHPQPLGPAPARTHTQTHGRAHSSTAEELRAREGPSERAGRVGQTRRECQCQCRPAGGVRAGEGRLKGAEGRGGRAARGCGAEGPAGRQGGTLRGPAGDGGAAAAGAVQGRGRGEDPQSRARSRAPGGRGALGLRGSGALGLRAARGQARGGPYLPSSSKSW